MPSNKMPSKAAMELAGKLYIGGWLRARREVDRVATLIDQEVAGLVGAAQLLRERVEKLEGVLRETQDRVCGTLCGRGARGNKVHDTFCQQITEALSEVVSKEGLLTASRPNRLVLPNRTSPGNAQEKGEARCPRKINKGQQGTGPAQRMY